MSKQTVSNPYTKDWQKEIETKNYEELIRIVAQEGNYNSEFIQMAKAKLEASEHYDEDEVQSQIEEIRKKPLPKQKDPADTILKVANIGCFIAMALFVLFGVLTIFVVGHDSHAMNNGIKGGMAAIIYGGCIGMYKIVKRSWRKRIKK